MHIKEYLAFKKISQEKFAQKLGVTVKTIWAHVNAHALPHKKLVKKMEKLSDGLITSDDVAKFYKENHHEEKRIKVTKKSPQGNARIQRRKASFRIKKRPTREI